MNLLNLRLCFLLACAAALPLAEAGAAVYYLSPSGDDDAEGTAPERAWKTLARASRADFAPGDAILLEGGQAFEGTLKFNRHDGGTREAPIRIGSHRLEEAGPATIRAGKGRGIDIYNASWIEVSHLRVTGDGPRANKASGILLHTSRPEGAGHVKIEHVHVSGFGKHGISIGAWESNRGYRDVQILHCVTHDNRRTGILTWGPWGPGIYAHSEIYIAHCEAYRMKEGSGITLSSVQGGIVERSIAHHNGEHFSGAAGIWAWDSDQILFQFNESYENKTVGVDGDGFDFDGGVTNSVMQYNYSHDNDAAGFLLAQYPGAPQAMNHIVIRYNISENDCRKKGYGAIHVWNGEDTHRISNVQIYQNTIYLGPGPILTDRSAIAVASPTKSVAVRNNLFYTSGGELLVSVVPDQEELLFQSNAYWSGDSPFQMNWKGSLYKSLGEWLDAADDQERLGSRVLAVCEDPLLDNPGGGGTLRAKDDLAQALSAYRLRAGSPLLRRGLNLRHTFGIDPGDHGFYGTPLPQGVHPAIGANVWLDAAM